MTKAQLHNFKPLVWLFLSVTIACVVAKFLGAEELKIDTRVIFTANLLLFLIASLAVILQLIAMKNANPHAMVRGVMASMLMKLLLLGIATFIYLYMAGVNRSSNAIYISMALYLIYTWMEVKIAMKLKSPTKNGGN